MRRFLTSPDSSVGMGFGGHRGRADSMDGLPHLQLEPCPVRSIPPQTYARFQQVLWGERAMDTLLQIVLIFAGVMAILGLLSVRNHPGGESQ